MAWPVRAALVAVFVVVAAAGLWRSQHQDVAALAPGLWPPWAYWPALACLALLLTQMPRSWPKAARRPLAVVALVSFALSGIVLDAVVAQVAMRESTGVVNSDQSLPRNLHRVSVATDGAAVTVLSPAVSFADRWTRESVNHFRKKYPGLTCGTTGEYAAGTTVEVRLDPDGSLYPRLAPAAGQPGQLPWLPRTGPGLAAYGVAVALGWLAILGVFVGVLTRGPLRSLDE